VSHEQSRDPVNLSQVAKLLEIPARYVLHVWFSHQVVGRGMYVNQTQKTYSLRSDPM